MTLKVIVDERLTWKKHIDMTFFLQKVNENDWNIDESLFSDSSFFLFNSVL